MLFVFSFIPLLLEIVQQRVTSNIPYTTLILLLLSFIIYVTVCFLKKNYVHVLVYTIAIIAIGILLHFKQKFDKENNLVIVEKSATPSNS